jgi:hypothetical protein
VSIFKFERRRHSPPQDEYGIIEYSNQAQFPQQLFLPTGTKRKASGTCSSSLEVVVGYMQNKPSFITLDCASFWNMQKRLGRYATNI